MDINSQIKIQIVKMFAKHDIKIVQADLATPPSAEMGDLALPCFELAKMRSAKGGSASGGKSPNEIAQELAQKIKPSGFVINIKSIGPYLNFLLDYNQVSALVLKEIKKSKSKYGSNKLGKSQKVMIEYSALNTHKEVHVGHLRNIFIGAALVNIYRSCGYKVIAASYLGDTGAHVAKTLWYLQSYVNQTDYPQGKWELGEFLGQSYTRSVAKLTEHPEFKEQVQDILKRIEDGDKDLLKFWQQTRQWSLDLFIELFKELGVKFDIPSFFESEEEKPGKKMLPKLLKYPFIKKSEGAIIADLKKYDLDVLVLLRKDGTAVYGLKDIPLALKKFSKYKIKKSLYLIDVRQSLYLKQIFKILELMGFKKEMIHVPYDFVQLKSGIMSSRSGNVVTYQEVKEVALAKVLEETKQRHADWSDEKINEVSMKIVLGALKFGMLKCNNHKVITFDIEESLDINGFTGPYLQYTTARINSILKKGRIKSVVKVDYNALAAPIEKQLVRDLANYPQVIQDSLAINDPSLIIQYLFNLAQNFNTFYHELPVLKAPADIEIARLELVKAVKQVLENGMGILGLPVLEEM